MAKIVNMLGRGFAAAVAVGTLALATKAAYGEGLSQPERNRALVAKGFEAWADGTGSPYDLLSEDTRWTITGNSLTGKTYPTKEAFMSEVIRPFNARMRDRLIPTVHRLYAEGDTVIAHFDAKGVATDGKLYTNSYAWILRMEAGRIVEAHAFFDAVAFDDLWRRVSPDQTK